MVHVMVSMSGLRRSEVVAGILDEAGGIEAVIDHPGEDIYDAGTGPEVLVVDLETYLSRKKGGFPPTAKVLVIAPDDEVGLPAIEGPLYGVIGPGAGTLELQTAVKAVANGVVLKEESGSQGFSSAKRISRCGARTVSVPENGYRGQVKKPCCDHSIGPSRNT